MTLHAIHICNLLFLSGYLTTWSVQYVQSGLDAETREDVKSPRLTPRGKRRSSKDKLLMKRPSLLKNISFWILQEFLTVLLIWNVSFRTTFSIFIFRASHTKNWLKYELIIIFQFIPLSLLCTKIKKAKNQSIPNKLHLIWNGIILLLPNFGRMNSVLRKPQYL